MGDTAEFLRELPSKSAEYEETLNSVRLFKYSCSNRFDVIQLEQLRQRIEKEELPLLKRLWEGIRLIERLAKHGEINKNTAPIIAALKKFAPLFSEKTVFQAPKIIHISKSQVKSLPKDKYKWETFRKLFQEEQELLKNSTKTKKAVQRQFKETRPTRLPLLSGKSTTIVLVLVMLGISGGFFMPHAKESQQEIASGILEVGYWGGIAPTPIHIDESDVEYSDITLHITRHIDGSATVNYYSGGGSVSVSASGSGSDHNTYRFSKNWVDVTYYRSGTTVRLYKQAEAEEVSSDEYFKEYFKNGGRLVNEGNYPDAISEFSYIINNKPDFGNDIEKKLAEAYFLYGKQFYDKKKYEEARSNFENAVKWDDSKSEYYNSLGNSLLLLKRYDEAVKEYEKAVLIDEDNYKAITGMGSAHYYLGDKEKACELWKKASALNDNADKYYKSYC